MAAPVASLLDIVDHLVDALRFYAIEHPHVLHRLLELLEQIGLASTELRTREQLDAHVQRVVDSFAASSPLPGDLDPLTEHAAQVRTVLLRATDGA